MMPKTIFKRHHMSYIALKIAIVIPIFLLSDAREWNERVLRGRGGRGEFKAGATEGRGGKGGGGGGPEEEEEETSESSSDEQNGSNP